MTTFRVLSVIAGTEFSTHTNLAIPTNLSYMPVTLCMLSRHVPTDGLLAPVSGRKSLGHFLATMSSE